MIWEVIKMKAIITRLSEDLHYQLKVKAAKEKKSIQELIEAFIKDYVKKPDKENKTKQ
jgi:predicted HicB family RNase H-like nuclease